MPYTQEELRNLKDNAWDFTIEAISVSSFLTEKTSKGIWKYDGQDIERFPLVYTPDYKYHFIPMPWVEGVKGPGIGEWIEVVINGIEPWGTCYLQILNGYVDVRKPHLFKQNNRIKEATLFCKPSRSDEKPFEMKIKFEDFVYVKNIVFDKSCRKIKIRIDSVYEGSKYDDTVITSIYTPGTVWSPF
ncbi:hypothetical protein HRI96_00795 [Treponema parvum]|uniref:NAD glycohydrolase translocation F5/8 type C domain-containing protein n=1 Tax=Treponema parvum TaxID=138851 RepID=A0A975EXM1_9SPIR|nr:hypothetical protein [Treponema parvum]QTQ10856.1 hypothetical protein HRI96_00795 [Treponema parvum]